MEQSLSPIQIQAGKGVNRSLMAIGAHADDIEMNVGGTLLKYHSIGYSVDYVMSTNNRSGQFRTKNKDSSLNRMMPTRKWEADVAAAAVCGLGETPFGIELSANTASWACSG